MYRWIIGLVLLLMVEGLQAKSVQEFSGAEFKSDVQYCLASLLYWHADNLSGSYKMPGQSKDSSDYSKVSSFTSGNIKYEVWHDNMANRWRTTFPEFSKNGKWVLGLEFDGKTLRYKAPSFYKSGDLKTFKKVSQGTVSFPNDWYQEAKKIDDSKSGQLTNIKTAVGNYLKNGNVSSAQHFYVGPHTSKTALITVYWSEEKRILLLSELNDTQTPGGYDVREIGGSPNPENYDKQMGASSWENLLYLRDVTIGNCVFDGEQIVVP
jgi:hypothetical protein